MDTLRFGRVACGLSVSSDRNEGGCIGQASARSPSISQGCLGGLQSTKSLAQSKLGFFPLIP